MFLNAVVCVHVCVHACTPVWVRLRKRWNEEAPEVEDGLGPKDKIFFYINALLLEWKSTEGFSSIKLEEKISSLVGQQVFPYDGNSLVLNHLQYVLLPMTL